MTGHGRGEASAGGIRAVVECQSVNRKGGEANVVMPRELAGLEPEIRERTLARVARGKVQVVVAVETAAEALGGVIDEARAAASVAELRRLRDRLDLKGDISIDTILAFPGVITNGSASARAVGPVVVRALDVALDALLAMRAREGAALKKELTRRLRELARLVRTVRPLARGVPGRHRDALLRRLGEVGFPLEAGDPRVITEFAVLAERCDITEELARIESHLGQFREKLASDEPVGRTLEFLAQEIARELHTTGAKAGDAAIARLVVDAKGELDKLREQLANVE